MAILACSEHLPEVVPHAHPVAVGDPLGRGGPRIHHQGGLAALQAQQRRGDLVGRVDRPAGVRRHEQEREPARVDGLGGARDLGAGGDPERVVHVEGEPPGDRLEALVQVEVVLEGVVGPVRVERRGLPGLLVQDQEAAPLDHGLRGAGLELVDVLERELHRVAVGAQLAALGELLDQPVHGVEAVLRMGGVGDLDGPLVAGGLVPGLRQRLQLLDDEGRDLPLRLHLADLLRGWRAGRRGWRSGGSRGWCGGPRPRRRWCRGGGRPPRWRSRSSGSRRRR